MRRTSPRQETEDQDELLHEHELKAETDAPQELSKIALLVSLCPTNPCALKSHFPYIQIRFKD